METTKSARLLRIARDALAKRAGAAEEEGAEAGFTLIELMVVLLIMAILLAIAIPTFLGVKGGAQDRAAQSNLSNALISSKSIYATAGTYPANITATLATQEPELSFLAPAGVPANNNQVSLAVSASGNSLFLVDVSASNNGTCWGLADNNGDAVAQATGNAPTGTSYAAWPGGANNANCNATYLLANAQAADWHTSYPSAGAAL